MSDELSRFTIGAKLLLGFGLLVGLTFLVISISYQSEKTATRNIEQTFHVRVPAALASSQAESALLKMLADVRGYLAFGGDKPFRFREDYLTDKAIFEKKLENLHALAHRFNGESLGLLNELTDAFQKWSPLPEILFELRDDQLKREPAYRILMVDSAMPASMVLFETSNLMEIQAHRPATPANMDLMKYIAAYQQSFITMVSGLRGYTTTRNPIFYEEYHANLSINTDSLETLLSQKQAFSESQQSLLHTITKARSQFLSYPEKIFEILESDRWREDLYLFQHDVIPLTQKMALLLTQLTTSQQSQLDMELNSGVAHLTRTHRKMVIGGGIAMIVGIILSIFLKRRIAGPVGRLTDTATQIRKGDLNVRAEIESGDEVGILAHTFNEMTGTLSDLMQETKSMIVSVREGNLNVQGRTEKFNGGWRGLIEEINALIRVLKERLEISSASAYEMDLARQIQIALLPQGMTHPDLEIEARMIPAAEVGGDYYDLLYDKENHLWLGIGDVSGNGVTTGLIMMMAQTINMTMTTQWKASPAEVVNAINAVLYRNLHERLKTDHYMSLVVVKYLGEGRFLHAGDHLNLIVYRKDRHECELIETFGLFANLLEDISPFTRESSFTLDGGDVLILYTDGLTEAFNPEGYMLGLDRLMAIVLLHATKPAKEMRDAIMTDVLSFTNQQVKDDMTLLVVRRIPSFMP